MLRNSLTGREFRGRNVVASMTGSQTFLQNMRVPQGGDSALQESIHREAASRIPYPVEETEIRFWDCAEVRQGDATRREVHDFACHRPIHMSRDNAILNYGLNHIVVALQPKSLL